ncbi:ATP-binding protein [Rosettibacter firmus]|uniref:ATP-binding protein n=1 Tax=Rosettibacter firmus TaxID=3111522 RepID=UPI00336C156B
MKIKRKKIFNIKINNDNSYQEVIQETLKYCLKLGFKKKYSNECAIISAELATNIIKYASFGEITLNKITKGKEKGIEIIAKDKGPGIENTELALQQGYSTGKSLGIGLPGVKRMVDEFVIKSILNKGTTVKIIKWEKSNH